MSYTTREQAMTALYNLLLPLSQGGNPSFKTISRRLQHWTQVDAGQQPALFLYEKPETHKRQTPAALAMRMLEADIFIYINVGLDANTIPVTILNPLLDLIDPNSGGVLKPDDRVQNRQTLGGVVYDCWIEGQLIKVPGDMDGQGIAVIPVKILLP